MRLQSLILGILMTVACQVTAQDCADGTDSRYVDCIDGTVLDRSTGLFWLKNANCYEQRDHFGALDLVAALADGQCGLTDGSTSGLWRLPTLEEWQATIATASDLNCRWLTDEFGNPPGRWPSLTDDSGLFCWRDGTSSFTGLRVDYPAQPMCLPPEPASNCITADYWASTVALDNDQPVFAWSVNLEYGDVFLNDRTISGAFFVWPVRDALAAPPTQTLSCAGFTAPLADFPVMVRKHRTLPLKAGLFDADDYPMSNSDLDAPPVVQVWFKSEDSAEAIDVTDAVLAAGQGDDGNQFIFTEDGQWQFKLSTRNYSAPGTYTVLMDSGDETEYMIDPACITEFVIE